jgi:hypothetical protein
MGEAKVRMTSYRGIAGTWSLQMVRSWRSYLSLKVLYCVRYHPQLREAI